MRCPQGGAVSGVLANYYRAPLFKMFAREGEQDQSELAQNRNKTRAYSETLITAARFIDDSTLYTASNDPTANAEKLQDVFGKVVTWATQNGLKIDMNKVEYICFTRPHKRRSLRSLW